jgi:SAM-dependent methyltransferase
MDLGRVKSWAGAIVRRDRQLLWRAADRWGGAPDDRTFIRMAYEVTLGRDPDPAGAENYRNHLESGSRSRVSMLEEMRSSDEFWFGSALRYDDAAFGIHRSRCLFVQMFRPAARIIDLGGTHQQRDDGALVAMGYPYDFERLVIVDLPSDERHELYDQGAEHTVVQSARGPVEYSFHSMADLSRYDDGSFDLVYSGQTFEHVPPDVGRKVLAEAFRVLAPGGVLYLDTPNGVICRMQMEGQDEQFTNPDHDVEYDHDEIVPMIEEAGFVVEQAWGLLHMPESASSGSFVWSEFGAHTGVFADIESSYLLAYACTKPA